VLDNVGSIPPAVTFKAAEAAMWQLVQRYTGRVGYRATVKAEGLAADPPVIDCSGWFGVLITAALNAENEQLCCRGGVGPLTRIGHSRQHCRESWRSGW
jgi:cobalamin biosynthesis protein CbiD